MENFSINSALTDAQAISIVESGGRFVFMEIKPKRIQFWDTSCEGTFFVDKGVSLSQLVNTLISEAIKDARYSGEQDAKREIRKVLGIEN